MKNEKKAKRKKYYPPRNCEVCGKEYIPHQHSQMYCSESCQNRANNCKRYGLPITPCPTWKPTKCPVCDSMFVPKRYNQKYCSKACHDNSHRVLMRTRDAMVRDSSEADMERKIMEYLQLPRDERLKKFETLSSKERNLAKKLWFKMHQSETIRNIGGLY